MAIPFLLDRNGLISTSLVIRKNEGRPMYVESGEDLIILSRLSFSFLSFSFLSLPCVETLEYFIVAGL